mgnify:CR=1 FL=1
MNFLLKLLLIFLFKKILKMNQITLNTKDCNRCLCYKQNCNKIVTADINCFNTYKDSCSSTIDEFL